jgi:hypothetical protein
MSLATSLGRMQVDWQRRSELLRRSVADLAATLLLVAIATVASSPERAPGNPYAEASQPPPSRQSSACTDPMPRSGRGADAAVCREADRQWSPCVRETDHALAERP